MKDLNISPGVVLMLTNVRVMLWLDLQYSSDRQVEIFSIFQSMKDLNIRPGVVLMVTNVRVMLRLDPQYSSDRQAEIFSIYFRV